MFTFKKFSKNLKRTVSGVLCCLILSGIFVVPVAAADGDPVTIGINYFGSYYSSSMSDVYGRNTPIWNLPFPSGYQASPSSYTLSVDSVDVDSTGWASGVVGVYFSYYFGSNVSGDLFYNYPTSNEHAYRLTFMNSYGETESVPVDVVNFNPVVDTSSVFSYSPGVSIRATVSNPSYSPVTDVAIRRFGGKLSTYEPATTNGTISLFVPSVSYIIMANPSDLEALENVADSIAQQSQVLEAMYGDIMTVLNDMYTKLGSIESAAQLANTYFSQMIPLLQGINTNTSNIYSLLQTQFQLLRTLIATESDDIQAAIEQQTDDLIAYFDTVFSDAVGDMPEKTDDLNQSVGDVSDAESNYQSTATQRFDQLTDTFSGGFSGGTLAGVTLAATLFTRVWNALGDYVIVYTWPLFLGLCLVILGRMSRLSGGQSSSEKHRGDSDA